MSMRFFALQPATMEKPTGLLRLTMGAKELTLERFDAKIKMWVDDPKAIQYLSGDDADATEVSASQAEKLMEEIKPSN